MDGHIGVRSVEGEGSTFWFTVNLATNADALLQAGPETTASSAPVPGLVVTDPALLPQTAAQPVEAAAPLDDDAPGYAYLPPTVAPDMGQPRGQEAEQSRLPAAVPVARTQAPDADSPLDPAQMKPVLLVEDNAVNRQLALLQLKQLGYRSSAVTNGKAALQEIIAKGDDYSMVLMDCQMPDMDGFAATEAIRRHEADLDRHIPIIAMTANAMQGDRERCLASGMDDYISKPVSRSDLGAVLAKWSQLVVA